MDMATENQLRYIQELQDISIYPLPKFMGETENEAAEYIDRYDSVAHDNLWAVGLLGY